MKADHNNGFNRVQFCKINRKLPDHRNFGNDAFAGVGCCGKHKVYAGGYPVAVTVSAIPDDLIPDGASLENKVSVYICDLYAGIVGEAGDRYLIYKIRTDGIRICIYVGKGF